MEAIPKFKDVDKRQKDKGLYLASLGGGWDSRAQLSTPAEPLPAGCWPEAELPAPCCAVAELVCGRSVHRGREGLGVIRCWSGAVFESAFSFVVQI